MNTTNTTTDSSTVTVTHGVAQIETNEYGERRKLSLPEFILKAASQWEDQRSRLSASVSVHAHRLVEMEMEHRRIIGIANAQAGEIATQHVHLYNAVVELSNWDLAERQKPRSEEPSSTNAVDPPDGSTPV